MIQGDSYCGKELEIKTDDDDDIGQEKINLKSNRFARMLKNDGFRLIYNSPFLTYCLQN